VPDQSIDFLKGTLDLLILRTLSWGPTHGYGIARWIEENSGEVMRVEEGSLYPALHKLEDRGWIAAEWGQSANNRRAKYYRLTPQGRKQLRAAHDQWSRFAGAMFKVLDAVPQDA
jgi:PadR family transcriptional regulator, regulatory protein PadR